MAGGLDWKPMSEFHGEPDVHYLFRVEWVDTWYDAGEKKKAQAWYYDAGQWTDTGFGVEVAGQGNTYDMDSTGQYVRKSGRYMTYTLTHFATINEPEG